MISMYSLLLLAHLLGLALGVGAATVKLTLLAKCTSDPDFVPVFMRIIGPITRLIVFGLIVLTVSGIIWMIKFGYSFTPLLTAKLVLVALLWVLGPIIDNVVEPKWRQLAPVSGETASPAFAQAQKQFLTLETVATGVFYVITVLGVLL